MGSYLAFLASWCKNEELRYYSRRDSECAEI